MDEQKVGRRNRKKVESSRFSILETHYRAIGICVCSALSIRRLNARRDTK